MQHKHRCTHARVTKQLFAGLAQGQFDYSAEMPIDGELQLVGMPSSSSFALITIKQRQTMLPRARYEAAITNKCHSVRCAYSIVIVILVYFVHQAHMDVCLRRRYTYFSLSLSFLLHPVCCNYSTALFIMVLILMLMMMMMMVCAYYSIVNPPGRITSSCIWRVTMSTTGRRTRPRRTRTTLLACFDLDTQGEKCTWPANSRIVQVEVASLCGIAFGAANRNDSSARWLHTYRLVGEAVEQ